MLDIHIKIFFEIYIIMGMTMKAIFDFWLVNKSSFFFSNPLYTFVGLNTASLPERRSFFRERKVSAAQFFEKERGGSAVHKNALFFSTLFDCTLTVKLLKNLEFSASFS